MRELYSALVTPYNAGGEFDPTLLEGLLKFQKEQGLDGVYVGGSSGEAVLQSVSERQAVLKAVAEHNPGLKLIAHVGTVATRDAQSLAEVADRAGYSAVSAISPFYYGFSEDELFAHYTAISEASALPLIVYSFPQKGLGLSRELCDRLLANPKISGVKYTSADLYMLDQLKRAYPNKIFFNGFDEILLAGLTMGADGGIGTTYNFMGDVFVAIRAEWEAGNQSEALRLQGVANDMIERVYPSIIDGTKYVLARMGHQTGGARPPFQPRDWSAVPGLDAAIDNLMAWRESRK
ncbi:N-acetylneuraminate lyase [Pelagibacterium flavum]|uniref:N-acetylneuraminate lyase n=1 Tax=Pelagibacterium flavum TaxID=2984530 RepID=A0ABY6IUJ5_9HYPH|nr:N-acetylneuraminate lyase [Pelagibacterium sp. YIM 151497]UYQ74114.1 N-acetylneuraminate lyase [Pelagibacterium sp. YIM 151497]